MARAPNEGRSALIYATLVGMVMAGVSVRNAVERPVEVGTASVSSLALDEYLAIECGRTQPMADGTVACLRAGEWIGVAAGAERLGPGQFAGVLRPGQRVQETNPRAELPSGVGYPERHLAARPGIRPRWQLAASIAWLVAVAVGWIAWARARRRAADRAGAHA